VTEPTFDCAGCGDPAHTGDYVFGPPDGVVIYHFDCLPVQTAEGFTTEGVYIVADAGRELRRAPWVMPDD
jgi:hypothetical protein